MSAIIIVQMQITDECVKTWSEKIGLVWHLHMLVSKMNFGGVFFLYDFAPYWVHNSFTALAEHAQKIPKT